MSFQASAFFKVLDIVEIDQVKETFTANFKMEFDYVDPTLITTWQIIKYLKTEGPTTSVVTVEAHILGYEPGDSEKQKVVLGVLRSLAIIHCSAVPFLVFLFCILALLR